MRRATLAAIAASSFMVFAAAAAQTPTAAPTAPASAPATPVVAAATPGNDLGTIVCQVTTIVGSRFPSRLCLTKRRWKQMHEDAMERIRVIQASGEGQPMLP